MCYANANKVNVISEDSVADNAELDLLSLYDKKLYLSKLKYREYGQIYFQ